MAATVLQAMGGACFGEAKERPNGLRALSPEDKARIGQLIKVLAQERRDKENYRQKLDAQDSRVKDLESACETSRQHEAALLDRVARSLTMLRTYQKELVTRKPPAVRCVTHGDREVKAPERPAADVPAPGISTQEEAEPVAAEGVRNDVRSSTVRARSSQPPNRSRTISGSPGHNRSPTTSPRRSPPERMSPRRSSGRRASPKKLSTRKRSSEKFLPVALDPERESSSEDVALKPERQAEKIIVVGELGQPQLSLLQRYLHIQQGSDGATARAVAAVANAAADTSHGSKPTRREEGASEDDVAVEKRTPSSAPVSRRSRRPLFLSAPTERDSLAPVDVPPQSETSTLMTGFSWRQRRAKLEPPSVPAVEPRFQGWLREQGRGGQLRRVPPPGAVVPAPRAASLPTPAFSHSMQSTEPTTLTSDFVQGPVTTIPRRWRAHAEHERGCPGKCRRPEAQDVPEAFLGETQYRGQEPVASEPARLLRGLKATERLSKWQFRGRAFGRVSFAGSQQDSEDIVRHSTMSSHGIATPTNPPPPRSSGRSSPAPSPLHSVEQWPQSPPAGTPPADELLSRSRGASSRLENSSQKVSLSCLSSRASSQCPSAPRLSTASSLGTLRSSWPGPLHDGYYGPTMFEVLDSVESCLVDTHGVVEESTQSVECVADAPEWSDSLSSSVVHGAIPALAPQEVAASTPPARSREFDIHSSLWPGEASTVPRSTRSRAAGIARQAEARHTLSSPYRTSLASPPQLEEVDDVLALLSRAPAYA